jgi:hypothetical protein
MTGLVLTAQLTNPSDPTTEDSVIVPIGGNTWRIKPGKTGGNIKTEGITDWTDKSVSFVTYVRINKTGILNIQIFANTPDGSAEIMIENALQQKTVSIRSGEKKYYDTGEWEIRDTGYIAFKISGISKTALHFSNIDHFKISGVSASHTSFVKNNEGNFFYWGRRGPSVHLNYPFDDTIPSEWFYNEITVPKGQDVVGSYFMAAGFAEGYFGIQVNSNKERRILFSVWSSFKTNDPKQIPADEKIQMIRKGKDVYTGEFGNEGSGGQSYLRYNWKSEVTYGFLLRGAPDGFNHTIYSAWFFDPATHKWILIASFRRPKTNTYLKKLHSFLENFEPETGNVSRKVIFKNQWICDINGNWTELYRSKFTGDNTARVGYRMDYGGGSEGNAFFLRNCGFFNEFTPHNTLFERIRSNRHPDIQFEKLP